MCPKRGNTEGYTDEPAVVDLQGQTYVIYDLGVTPAVVACNCYCLGKRLRAGTTVGNKKGSKLCINEKETICSGITKSMSMKRVTLDI